MADNRQLWTGPFGMALADRALDLVPIEAAGLWIVPSSVARRRVTERLARRMPVAGRLRVWCWDDLWRAVRTGTSGGPTVLSEAGERAALGEAIGQARRDGSLRIVKQVADTPGFRRRLRGRIAAWSRIESDPDEEPPPGDVAAEEWAIFGRYRAILKRLGALDQEALTAWASWTLREDPPPDLRRFGYVTVLDPTVMARARWRALEHFEERSFAVLATLPFDPDPDLADAYATIAPIHEHFIKRRYTETAYADDPDESARPAGLRGIERELFLDGGSLDDADGLQILGAPEGDGIGMVVARSVRELLTAGVEPDDVLVLVPRWDDQAALVLETLRAWGLPASAAEAATLTTEPAVSALRLAMSIPVKGWDTGRVIRLLRNSQVHPDWGGAASPLDLAAAAAAVRETSVFRGRAALLDALRRAGAADDRPTTRGDERRRALRAARARAALGIVEGLAASLGEVDQPAPWGVHVDRLHHLAARLGLDGDEPALQHLGNALDDHADILDRLGQRSMIWTWAEFVAEVDALVKTCPVPAPAVASGAVRVATVLEAEGLRARHVLLANLGEGTFPARDAVNPDPGAPEDPEPGSIDRPRLALALEMLHFLRVVGSADESLTLVYPTTDEKGQTLLAAGFLDDVRRLLNPEDLARHSATIHPLGAVLDASLAGAPAEARVRAVRLASEGQPRFEELRRLARSPIHRPALLAAASAFRVAHERSRQKDFGPHDGQLSDPRIAPRIARDFGPDRPAFSPSQLESLAFCPFQFYLRYVLHLEPTDDRDELDDDRATRGRLVHKALEDLHSRLRDCPPDGSATLAEHIAHDIEDVLIRLIEQDGRTGSAIDPGRRRIEQGQLIRTGQRYAGQFARYAEKLGAGAEGHQFEVDFGKPETTSLPGLVLGQEPDAVQLQGIIDRIDVVRLADRTLFRVIDYKTGSCPSQRDVDAGLALQLPLYALAVERIILADQAAAPVDVGYWALASKGYRSVKTMARIEGDTVAELETWQTYRRNLETYVLALVARLRAAAFPVHPRSADCTRTCDYRAVCRIQQVKAAGKVWADAPRMEPTR